MQEEKYIEKKCKKHELTCFIKQKNGRYRCLKCRNERVIQYRRDKKLRLIEMFGGKCEMCGYSKCVRSLQFHHVDPSHKNFNVSHHNTIAFKKIIEEALKCILLCSNCHGEIEDGISQIPEEIIKKRFSESLNYKKEIIIREKTRKKQDEDKTNKKKDPNWKNNPRPYTRKVKRPPKETIIQDVENLGYSGTGRKYGVSDNAIRKWLKWYNNNLKAQVGIEPTYGFSPRQINSLLPGQ